MSHCGTCRCFPEDEAFALRPSVSSEAARRQAKEAAEAAVRAAREKRGAR